MRVDPDMQTVSVKDGAEKGGGGAVACALALRRLGVGQACHQTGNHIKQQIHICRSHHWGVGQICHQTSSHIKQAIHVRRAHQLGMGQTCHQTGSPVKQASHARLLYNLGVGRACHQMGSHIKQPIHVRRSHHLGVGQACHQLESQIKQHHNRAVLVSGIWDRPAIKGEPHQAINTCTPFSSLGCGRGLSLNGEPN